MEICARNEDNPLVAAALNPLAAAPSDQYAPTLIHSQSLYMSFIDQCLYSYRAKSATLILLLLL